MPVPGDLSKHLKSLVQRGLASLGYYDGTFKGLGGPKTDAAYDRYVADQESDRKPADIKGLADRIVAVAAKEVGVREIGGNNKGPRVQEYQRATNLSGTGWPWCAAFICWCIREATKGMSVPFKLPKTALAYGFYGWAGENGIDRKKNPGVDLKPGDIVAFKNFSHVAIVAGHTKGGYIDTIEGNTDARGSRDGKKHGGVWKKRRRVSGIRERIRIA